MLQVYFDRFAIALSSICAIHCVALPLVVVLMPLLATTINHGNILHEFWFHQFILVFILPVSIFSLFTGYRCHKQLAPILLGAIGLAILTTTALFAEYLIAHKIMSTSGETALTIFGGIIHAVGHIMNILATKTYRIS